MTNERLELIRQLLAEGKSPTEVARLLHISRASVYLAKIRLGITKTGKQIATARLNRKIIRMLSGGSTEREVAAKLGIHESRVAYTADKFRFVHPESLTKGSGDRVAFVADALNPACDSTLKELAQAHNIPQGSINGLVSAARHGELPAPPVPEISCETLDQIFLTFVEKVSPDGEMDVDAVMSRLLRMPHFQSATLAGIANFRSRLAEAAVTSKVLRTGVIN
jgi:DNA-binding CsgD family transcriptional regulator